MSQDAAARSNGEVKVAITEVPPTRSQLAGHEVASGSGCQDTSAVSELPKTRPPGTVHAPDPSDKEDKSPSAQLSAPPGSHARASPERKLQKNPEDTAGSECRICMGAETGPLYTVCSCHAGVHEQCLQKWIQCKPGKEPTCEVCKAPYAVRMQKSLGCDSARVCGLLCKTWWQGRYCAVVSVASLVAVNFVVAAVILFLVQMVVGGGVIPLKFPTKETLVWLFVIAALGYWFFRCIEEVVACLRSSPLKPYDFLCCCVSRLVIDRAHAKKFTIECTTDAECKQAMVEV